jgi:uncharacterized coiled-coil DUF342 family protein
VLTKELKDFIKKYTALESELYQRYAELRQKDAELEQKHAEIHQKHAELRQREIELHQKEAELYQTASELAQKSTDFERLSNENMHLSHAMDQMQATLGWQFLEKMRDIRDKMLPRETARGKIYQRIISRLKGRGREG